MPAKLHNFVDNKGLMYILNNMLKMGTKSDVQKNNILTRIDNERRLTQDQKDRGKAAFIKNNFTKLHIEDLQ